MMIYKIFHTSKIVYILFITLILFGCESHVDINPRQIKGYWVSESKEPLNMNQTLLISEPDSLVFYDPAIGDTVYVFENYRIKSDTIIFTFQNDTKFRCRIKRLDNKTLILRGLPSRENRSEKFVRKSTAS